MGKQVRSGDEAFPRRWSNLGAAYKTGVYEILLAPHAWRPGTLFGIYQASVKVRGYDDIQDVYGSMCTRMLPCTGECHCLAPTLRTLFGRLQESLGKGHKRGVFSSFGSELLSSKGRQRSACAWLFITGDGRLGASSGSMTDVFGSQIRDKMGN